jgi:hypothetical protein
MGLIRYKTLSPAGAPHDDATHLKWAGQVGVPLQGVFFLRDGFPMALPWAGKEVPLAGRQIANHPENSYRWHHCFHSSGMSGEGIPDKLLL